MAILCMKHMRVACHTGGSITPLASSHTQATRRCSLLRSKREDTDYIKYFQEQQERSNNPVRLNIGVMATHRE